jgi:ATPase complex subunit ATP10
MASMMMRPGMLIPCTASRFSSLIGGTHRGWVKGSLCTTPAKANSSILLRGLATAASGDSASDGDAHRHTGIRMHPDSISKSILPGNMTIRKNRSGDEKKRYTELVYGYFWMIKDLRKTDDKPVLSNDKLIPESIAKPFPALTGLKSLSGEKVDIPAHFLRKNRSRDAAAQCTLVAVSFRDFGYKLLDTWIEPFESALQGNDRVEIVKMNMSEGWLNKWVLQILIQQLMKKNTPVPEHDRTFLYFQNDLEPFRDALRMHNVLTGYVFLLDGLGRVRFAGSGSADPKEIENLVELTHELTPLLKPAMNRNYGKQASNKAPGKRKR